MPDPYVKQTWANGVAGATPITAARLSHIEDGVENATVPDGTYADVGASNIQATARKLADAYGDVTIQLLGDSIVASWVPPLITRLSAEYPHRSIRTYLWNDATATYGAPTTNFTGSGSTWINIYNGAKGGTIWEFALVAPEPHWASIQADCCVIAYGVNQGKTASAVSRLVYTAEWQRLAAVYKEAVPSADLLLVSQNPRIDAGYEVDLATVRAQSVRNVAAEVGAAYGPVTEAFLAVTTADYLDPDGIHPNALGANLYADTLFPLFKLQPHLQPSARTASPLLVPGVNLAINCDLASFDGTTGGLTGWLAVNATLSKNTTNFESRNGYGVRIQASASAQSRIEQEIPLARVRGRIVTVAARIRIPAGQGNVTGRTEIITTGSVLGTVFAQSPGTQAAGPRDVFFWEYVTMRVPVDATTCKVKVIAGATTEPTADITVDRVSVVLGTQPRDIDSPVPVSLLYPGLRKFKPARWFTSDPHTVSSITVQVGWAFCAPFFIPHAQAFVAMAVEVVNLGVGATLTLGVYASDAFDQPASLLFTAGVVDGSSNGVKELVINQTLSPGWYWIGSLALGANVGVRSLGGPSHPLVMNAQNTLSAASNAYLATGLAALPATWVATAAAVGPPKVALKTAT